MNIYIKDFKTKELYASVRNVDKGFYDILHRMLCYTGCVALFKTHCVTRINYVTVYVNDVTCYMRDFVRRIVFDARIMYRNRFLEVK